MLSHCGAHLQFVHSCTLFQVRHEAASRAARASVDQSGQCDAARGEDGAGSARHRVASLHPRVRGRRTLQCEPIILYTLFIPFLHLHYHIYTYVHPLYMYTHHIYTMYTPNTPLYTPYIHPIYALKQPISQTGTMKAWLCSSLRSCTRRLWIMSYYR